MKSKRVYTFCHLLLLAFLSLNIRLQAQDTIIAKSCELPSISISYVRAYTTTPGLVVLQADSIQQSHYQAGTLTDLLGANGLLFLKSYGVGNLATTSVRGASANQTSVLWNGINLQSPTNGISDLSLMPSILCDNVSFQTGGGSAGWGSGAIGGVIQTNSYPRFSEGIRARYTGQVGSFGELDQGVLVGFSNSKISSDIRIYNQQAKNDFTFNNTARLGNPLDTVSNSDFLQRGIFGESAMKFKDGNQFVSVKAWYQSSDRRIPPTMLETSSEARQKDEFFRAVANYKYFSKTNFLFEIKSSVLTEFMDFIPGYSQRNSLTHSISFINEADIRFKLFDKVLTYVGLNQTNSKADVTGYVPSTVQNRASLFLAFSYILKSNWNFALNFRDEEVQGKITPLVGSLGVEWSRMKYLTIKTNISRNYRLPTFNDLYWQPGGNLNLKPEDSWNEDVTADFHYKKNGFHGNYSCTIFNRNTTNWILWQPGPGYWSPENLLSVWSRGFENRLKLKYTKDKFDFTLIGGYDYVLATNEKANSPGDVSLGKQLMYVPTNQFYGLVQFAYSKYYLEFNERYTGLRFTATDHSTYLNPFMVTDATVGKRFDYKKSYGDIFFRVNNLLDSQYQAISWRAMPGRNFQVGITIDFKMLVKDKSQTIN